METLDKDLAVGEAPVAFSPQKVKKTFEDAQGNEVEVIKDITLDVRESEFISIVGPSGCGKTTMFNIISNLLPPTSGDIVHRKMNVTSALARISATCCSAIFCSPGARFLKTWCWAWKSKAYRPMPCNALDALTAPQSPQDAPMAHPAHHFRAPYYQLITTTCHLKTSFDAGHFQILAPTSWQGSSPCPCIDQLIAID